MNDKSGPYDSRYLAGIDYFNRCEFFEAHEVWEDLWVDVEGPPRTFYQGWIQVAGCLHHFGNGNIRGSRKLYHSSCTYLEPHLPVHQGLCWLRSIQTLEPNESDLHPWMPQP